MILENHKSTAFNQKVKEISKRLRINPSWLMGIMWHESRLNHRAVNSIGAVGLIQFLPSTAASLGTSSGELLTMSEIEQLNYVEKYYLPAVGRIKRLTDLYVYTFFPVAVLRGWPDNKVLEYGHLSAAKIASQNKPMDLNKNGKITVSEVRREAIKSFPSEIRHLEKDSSGLFWVLAGVVGYNVTK